MVAIPAERVVRPLRGMADDGNFCVDEKVQPVERLLHGGAAFQPLRAKVVAAGQYPLDEAGATGQADGRRLGVQVSREVPEVVRSGAFLARFCLACPARARRAPLRVAARRAGPAESEAGPAGQQVVDAVGTEPEPVHLLVDPAPVRVERLTPPPLPPPPHPP